MNRLLILPVLLLTLLVGNPAVSADFQRGADAYRSGDYATALREWKPLAEQGNADAQFNLGLMYEKGWGVPQDYKTAMKWYRLAAEQGDADSQFNSTDFQKGLDAAQKGDFATALKEWKLTAEQGYVSAQSNLGRMYEKGRGVLQDYKTAVKWWKLSAEQGHASAQTNLGWVYGKGQGVIQDNVYAHMWGNLAASNGDENGAKLRDLVAKIMTPSQLEKAQDFARECVKKNYKGC